MISKPWNVIVRKGPPASFWLVHPMGGFFELPPDEYDHARVNGSAVVLKPPKLLIEKLEMQLESEQ